MVVVNAIFNSFQKGAWVMVKGNEGGIKVETPHVGPDSRTREFQMQGEKRL
jgi:hypothetical protein